MSDRRRRLYALGLTLALVAANLFTLNYLVAGWSTGRLDLTGDRIYSIAPATKRLLTSLDEQVTVYGFFSERTHPKLAPLVPEIRDLLEEYRAVSGGRVRVELIDPGTDEQAERLAIDRFGVKSTPFQLATKYEAAIVNAWFGIVVQYGDEYVRYEFDDLIQVEPTPDGDVDVRLRNLEYDLTRAIKKVVYGFRSTHDLFERISEPVTLLAIWSPAKLPAAFAEVPEAVRKAAEELKEKSAGRFEFKELDPSDDPGIAAGVAEQFDARPMSLGLFEEGSFYLYAILQVGDVFEPIPLTTGAVTSAGVREAVENALKRYTPGFLKTVGLVMPGESDLPIELQMQMGMPRSAPKFEEIKRFLAQDYRTQEVQLSREVPSQVDVLVVLEPKGLDQAAIFRLDQYLMRGGRVILCAGRYEVQFGEGLSLSPIDSGLDEWLAGHGISIEPTLVLDDRNQALPIPATRSTPFGMIRTWELAPYPYLVLVRDEGLMNAELTSRLDAVGIYWGSPITVDRTKAGELEILPLLQSSARSWTSDDLSQVSQIDYSVPAATEPHLLGVALSGSFKSQFAGRPIPDGVGGDASSTVPLGSSPETRLIVLGNSEFLSDFIARALSRVDGGFFVENLRFAQNMIDWIGLDNEMLEIRSRGLVSRRLTRLAPEREMIVEVANYVTPALILVVLGAFSRWRRRQAVPSSTAGRIAR